jgi:hypothetical protein
MKNPYFDFKNLKHEMAELYPSKLLDKFFIKQKDAIKKAAFFSILKKSLIIIIV